MISGINNMKPIKLFLLSLAGLMFSSIALAAPPTFNVCDKQISTIDIGMKVHDCVVDKNQPWNMEVELPDLEDGGTKLVKVKSSYIVICNANQRCAVAISDTIKEGAVMGDSPAGGYRLDYNYYIGVDANGNATEYLIGTGPHYGGAPAAGGAAVKGAKGAVTEASCAPQMDDDCTVNKKKVAKADLGKYLPVVNEADVRAAKGFCEYPICYNADNQPIGISK
jgi:hypothetical protein